MKVIDVIAFILLLIGGLNWGLYGAINVDVIAMVLGPMTTAARIAYILIGLAALYRIVFFKPINNRWCMHG